MKKIVISIIIFIVFLILLFFGLKLFLNTYTNHGKTIMVPDVIDMQSEIGIETLKTEGFECEIIDTVFDKRFDKNKIVEQFPEANAAVKKGRVIKIKINSNEDEIIAFPFVDYLQIKDAMGIINNAGLRIEKIRYEQDFAENTINRVMKIFYNGKLVSTGQKIKKHSKIELVLSLDDSDATTTVPNVEGQYYEFACDRLIEKYINPGKIKFDKSVVTKRDSLDAVVYKQSPKASTTNKVDLGSNVDIWLTIDEKVIEEHKKKSNNKSNKK